MSIKLDKSKFTREFARQTKLAHLIDRAIENEDDFEWKAEFLKKKSDKGFHPSSDCLPSPYELYQSIFHPEPRKYGADLKKTFTVGHFWHQYLQFILVEKLSFCSWDDIEVHKTYSWGLRKNTPYHYVSGSADAIVEIPGHGRYLVDFKTQKSLDFRLNDFPDWCKDKYMCQLNIYMLLHDLDKALFFCINKDSPHSFKEIEIVRNQRLIDDILYKWKVTSEYIAKQEAPPEDLDWDFATLRTERYTMTPQGSK